MAHQDSTPQKQSFEAIAAHSKQKSTVIQPHFYNSTGKAHSQNAAALENSGAMNQIWKLSNQTRKDNTQKLIGRRAVILSLDQQDVTTNIGNLPK